MRFAAVLLVGCATAHAPIADEWAPPTDESVIEYPLVPTVRSASGGAITVVGDSSVGGSTLAVPYAPRLTLNTALALAGQTTNAGTLFRGDLSYDLPVAAIRQHRMPDLELAPGDVIVLREELCTSVADPCD